MTKAIDKIPELRHEFWDNVNVTGNGQNLNMALEKAGRVADFLEFGELMCRDAFARRESAGGHFRAEYQTSEGEALRNDQDFCHSAVWEYIADGEIPTRHQEELKFETVELATRSYK